MLQVSVFCLSVPLSLINLMLICENITEKMSEILNSRPVCMYACQQFSHFATGLQEWELK